MQFVSLYTNQTINTDNYLACFVDEYTGDVKEDRRVLDKRVRKLWFRSSMPKAVIHTDVNAILLHIADMKATYLLDK